jgi:hypothetical protein
MTIRETLDDDSVERIREGGLAVADIATMSNAIHAVYCGVEPDHDGPNDKDRIQAQALMDELRREIMTL